MNQERLDVNVEFRKARGTKDQKDQVASIHWVIEKSRDFKIKKKKFYFCFIDYALQVTTNCGKFSKRWEYQNTLSVF